MTPTQLNIPIYYYDDNGYKIGPFNKKELYALAERGTINPETRITDDKIEVKAKEIPKLQFYAPEYHRAEEVFSTENINRIAIEQAQRKATKENSKEFNLEKITRHPLVVTTVILIAITALTSTITCYILVSTVITLNRLTKEFQEPADIQRFDAPEINWEPRPLELLAHDFAPIEFPKREFPEGRVVIPQRIPDRYTEMGEKFQEKLALEKFAEMMRPVPPNNRNNNRQNR